MTNDKLNRFSSNMVAVLIAGAAAALCVAMDWILKEWEDESSKDRSWQASGSHRN